jgi:hypothetical protein
MNGGPRREIIATQHPHAAHQQDSAVFPHRHGCGAHRLRASRRRQEVQDAVDWARRRPLHPLTIFHLVACQRERAHARAEAALQVLKHHLVSSRAVYISPD